MCGGAGAEAALGGAGGGGSAQVGHRGVQRLRDPTRGNGGCRGGRIYASGQVGWLHKYGCMCGHVRVCACVRGWV